jgi:hypothetical protein
MKQLLAFATIALLVPTGVALAKNPCKDDKVKFCNDVKSGGGEVKACLAQHKDQLSDACKERMADKSPKSPKSSEKSSDKAAPEGEKSAPMGEKSAAPEGQAPAEAAAPGNAADKPE